MTDFRKWTLKDAQNAVASATKRVPGGEVAFKANRAMVEDTNYWRDGEGWFGPIGTPETKEIILRAVQRQFSPVDSVGEVLTNFVNGMIGTEAAVGFAPVAAPAAGEESAEETAKREKAAIDRMVAAVSHWWDRKDLWKKAGRALKRSRYGCRGALRLVIPAGKLDQARDEQNRPVRSLPTGLTLEDALDRIEVADPTPDAAHVYVDPVTQQTAAIFLYEYRDPAAQAAGEEAGKGKKAAEIWFQDEQAQAPTTVVRTLIEGVEQVEEITVPLGGRLPMAEMTGELLITEPVRRQADRLNYFESVLVRTTEAAGFAERYTTNAKPNGIWLKTPPANEPPLDTHRDGATTWYLHRAPRTLGSGYTTELIGIDLPGATPDQKGSVASPGVIFKEPTDPGFAIKAAEHARFTRYHDCKQAHLGIADEAAPSGFSRVQARAEFESDLTSHKGALETMLRTIIESAIALAAPMTSETGVAEFLGRFRCVVTARVNAGPISADEQRAINERMKEGNLSRESGMALQGVEDVDAETDRIDADPAIRRARIEKAIEVLTAAELRSPTAEARLATAYLDELGYIEDEAEQKLIEAEFKAASERALAARDRQRSLLDDLDDDPDAPPADPAAERRVA